VDTEEVGETVRLVLTEAVTLAVGAKDGVTDDDDDWVAVGLLVTADDALLVNVPLAVHVGLELVEGVTEGVGVGLMAVIT
jgi:hypothetical protein